MINRTTNPFVLILGKLGRPVACHANFVEIISDIDRPIHQLHVGFEPEIDAKQVRCF